MSLSCIPIIIRYIKMLIVKLYNLHNEKLLDIISQIKKESISIFVFAFLSYIIQM